MDIFFSPGALVSAALFLALALVVFSLLLRPLVSTFVKAYQREIIEEKNIALALLIGLLSVSLSIIVAAAVH
jgi:uncharacterized membrane protein YjfL (UPF0719 family)